MHGTDRAQRAAAATLAGLAALAAGCSPVDPASGGGPPFRPVGSVEDIMHDVVYPHAEVVWDAVGTIIDQAGTHEIRPRSEEEWLRVTQSALTVAEAGNLLLMEGRAKDEEAWRAGALQLIDAASQVMEVSLRSDPEAVFEAGGVLYAACNNCHEQYWERPPSAMRP